jgi:hypothetical protein
MSDTKLALGVFHIAGPLAWLFFSKIDCHWICLSTER